MSFGEKLAKLRKEQGLSQEDLANELNVSRQAVSKWESNSSYPETEKIVAICKLFNSSMDELIGLKEPVKKEKRIMDYLSFYLDMFIKGIKMFYSMTFVQKIKCLFEMGFYALIIILFLLLGNFIIQYVLDNIFNFLPYEIFNSLKGMFNGILIIIYFIITLYLLVKLYKIRKLDYYEEYKEKISIKNVEEKEKIKIKEEKIIIRDNNEFEPYKILKKIFILLLKFMAFFLLIPLLVCFVFLIALTIFVIYFAKNGILLIYGAICLFSLILGIYLIIEILIKLILSIEIKVKKVFIMFIIALIIFGISSGLIACELSTYKIIEENHTELTNTFNIVMEPNLILKNMNCYITEIVFEDRSDILVEYYTLDKKHYDINEEKHIYNINNNNYITYDYWSIFKKYEMSIKDYINEFLNYIKKKEIKIYTGEEKIVIHISKENYQIIEENINYMNNFYDE